jgi:hypothetical protein
LVYGRSWTGTRFCEGLLLTTDFEGIVNNHHIDVYNFLDIILHWRFGRFHVRTSPSPPRGSEPAGVFVTIS